MRYFFLDNLTGWLSRQKYRIAKVFLNFSTTILLKLGLFQTEYSETTKTEFI